MSPGSSAPPMGTVGDCGSPVFHSGGMGLSPDLGEANPGLPGASDISVL